MNELKTRMLHNSGIISEGQIITKLMEMDSDSFMICDACGKQFKDREKYDKHRMSCSARNE
jgi:hypothetical protein